MNAPLSNPAHVFIPAMAEKHGSHHSLLKYHGVLKPFKVYLIHLLVPGKHCEVMHPPLPNTARVCPEMTALAGPSACSLYEKTINQKYA